MTAELCGGPYPLAIGNAPPTQVKVWFNDVAENLMVWNYKAMAWQPVSSTVVVGAMPPTTLGQLYIDQADKLWVFVDDLCELTRPVTPTWGVVNGAQFTAAKNPPLNPPQGSLWFDPDLQHLYVWDDFIWVRIGDPVLRLSGWVGLDVADIVERLRGVKDEHDLLACSDLLEEAANEIWRLRRMTAAFANPDKIFEFPPAPKSIDPTGW